MRSSNSNHRDTATRARRCRTDGADDTQSDQSLQNPNRKELRNHHQSRQPTTHLVTSTKDKTQRQQHTRRFDTCLTKAQSCSLERQLRADDQEHWSTNWKSAWLQGIWLGRDSKTDEHLIGTPNGMVRSRALKRRVERRRWDVTLLNAMIWDPWKPTPVTRGRPLKVRSDREPILMGPIPRLQVNPPDDADTVATPNLETASGTTTQSQSVAERTRVRLPESEAEGAPPVQKTRTTPTVPVTTTAETMATTTPTARALVERVGDEAGEDSQPVRMRRIAALMAECEDACTSEAIAEARRIHLEKLTKVKDAVIKVVPRTDATTKPLTGRWVDTMHDDGARKARWTTRGYEQTLNGNEDFFSATPAMMHFKMMLVEAALKGHVAAIGDCSGAFYQSPLNPDGTENQVWIEPPPEAELGPEYIWEAVSAFPGPKGAPRAWDSYSAKVLTNSMQNETVTVRWLLVLSFRTRTHRRESRKTHRRLLGDRARTERRTLSGTGTRQAEHAGCSALVQNRRRR